jgi:hypothetical protein
MFSKDSLNRSLPASQADISLNWQACSAGSYTQHSGIIEIFSIFMTNLSLQPNLYNLQVKGSPWHSLRTCSILCMPHRNAIMFCNYNVASDELMSFHLSPTRAFFFWVIEP